MLDYYTFKCTAASSGNDQLPDLRASSRSHFIATTVDLLTTGVDVPCVKNIVFFKYLKSPISFYQMVGRGTRIDEVTGKLMFRVYDYTDATRLFGKELSRDYSSFLRHHGLPEWPPNHPALMRFKERRCATLNKFRAWVADEVKRTTTAETVDPTHVFTLSQVYEGLLLKMGEKGNDGGQFFTPRQVIKAMVQVIAPTANETVYDPGCGTGGFLAQSYEFMRDRLGDQATAEQLETLKHRTFRGREKENLIYPIALANLVLQGIDRPNLWHGNTLTGMEIYGGLFAGAPGQFDIILTNPPFGGKEGKDAQTNFDYKTSATQALFLQHVIRSLKDGGRCGIVLDEGMLFRTNQDAFVKTKQKLPNDCDVWCIVSLPAGVFTAAGAGVKTNLIFFTKGKPTREIWYYDLKAVVDTRTPDELLDLIEAKGTEIAEALAVLRTGADS